MKENGASAQVCGKSEFLARGLFDGVDLAFLFHTGDVSYVNEGNVGCIAKKIVYKGKAAHAGGSPWNGANALYAATCGLNAVNAIRETFKDSDLIRVHPIVTHGGDMVNAIPERVELESYVRGKSFDAIVEANTRVNRALTGAALSLGVNVEIVDIPGYAPLYSDKVMTEICTEVFAEVMQGYELAEHPFSSGSTDMGDLCCVMPVLHPHVGGAKGTAHGSDYYIEDPEQACVGSAKWQLALARRLLQNGAARAKRIVAGYKPQFESVAAYLAYVDALNASGDRIEYRADGSAVVK